MSRQIIPLVNGIYTYNLHHNRTSIVIALLSTISLVLRLEIILTILFYIIYFFLKIYIPNTRTCITYLFQTQVENSFVNIFHHTPVKRNKSPYCECHEEEAMCKD